MPRIVDPNRYDPETLDKEIEKAEKKAAEEKAKKEAEKAALAEGKKKKEPNWSLLYVLFAVIFFGLALLVICLMNLWIHGTFGF